MIHQEDKNSKLLNEQARLVKQLGKLKVEHEDLSNELRNLSTNGEYISESSANISKNIPKLIALRKEAQTFSTAIKELSDVSGKINEKVKLFGIIGSRVDECQKRVSDLVDIQSSSERVQSAIIQEDFEEVAGHIHRFLSIDQSLLRRTASEAENVLGVQKSIQTLQDATSQLRIIIKTKFDEAAKSEDMAAVERFFKIFPLINMHKEGIQEFCKFLCSKVDSTSQQNLKTALSISIADKRYNITYADTITLLFEGVARIIEVNHPLIETYYGPGYLLLAFSILQKECDRQVQLIYLEFKKHRKIMEKLNQISEMSKLKGSFHKIDRIDPKSLDLLIHELSVMQSRTELYLKFVKRKVMSDISVGFPNEQEKSKKVSELETTLQSSNLYKIKIDLLSKYLMMEHYFIEESISKAVTMDMVETNQNVSSMVDDTFFIIRKCVRRAIVAGNLDGICTVINNACGILENEYCGVLRNRLRQGYPTGYLDLTQAYNVLQTSLQQGRLQSSDSEQTRTAFLMALNNANVSMEYIEALCDSTVSDVEQALPHITDNELEKLKSCLSGLSSVTSNLKETVNYGMQQLRVSAIKPRINPWVDAFLNINHQLDDEEFSEYEGGDTFINTLISNLDSLLNTFKETLTSSNYEALVGILATEISTRLEKVILKSKFNRLGGLVLDKEVRSLTTYFTTATSWSVRDKLSRLTQIATVLNLEKVSEIIDYWGIESSFTWRLTPTEIKNIMNLRMDFKIEEIRRLRL